MTNEIAGAVTRADGVPWNGPVIFDDTANAIQLLALLLLVFDLYLFVHGLIRRRKGLSVLGFSTTLCVTSIAAIFFVLWVALGELNLHIEAHIPYSETRGTMQGLLIGVSATLHTLRIPLPVIALGFIGAYVLDLPRRRRNEDSQQGGGHVR